MQSTIINTRKSRKNIYYFLTYGTCFFALGLSVSAFGPMLPFLADHVGVSFAQISFLFMTGSFGYLLGSAGGGRLFDRFNGHRLMLIAVIMMAATISLVPLIPYYYLFLFVFFILGVFQGIVDVGGNVNLLWVYQDESGPYMNALHFCFGVGAFVSPVILHLVMGWANGQITWPFWTLAVLSLPSIIGLLTLSSPKNKQPQQNEQTNNKVNSHLIVLMVILFFIYVGIESGFSGWIFTYATQAEITNQSGASFMNSLFWGALTFGRLISVPLAKKIKPSKLLLGNFFLAMLFLGLILIFPLEPLIVWVVSAGLGMALSSVFPTLLALGESRMTITGKVTGYFFFGSSSGAMLVPMLLGQIYDYQGGFEIMLTLFLLTAIGLAILGSVLFVSNSIAVKVR